MRVIGKRTKYELDSYTSSRLYSYRLASRSGAVMTRRAGGKVRRADNAHRSQACADCASLTDGAPGARRALAPVGSRVSPDARRVSPNPPKGGLAPPPWRPPGTPFPLWGNGKRESRRTWRLQEYGR